MAAEILEFFRLTEADGYIIMSAYGLHAPEVDHVQENQTGTNKAVVDLQDRKLISEPPAPAAHWCSSGIHSAERGA